MGYEQVFEGCMRSSVELRRIKNAKVTAKRHSHAGDENRETEATRDFVQEALQERLKNEAATSHLIAEITDMRSRLDDFLSKPLAGHNEGREVSGLVSHALSEQSHEENTNTWLQGVADDSDYRDKRGTNCSLHESLATIHLASKRLNCWSQKNSALGNHKVNEVMPHPDRGLCADAFACDQDTILAGKQLRCHPERPSFQQKRDEDRFLLEKKGCSRENGNSIMGSDKENIIQFELCHNDVAEECCILQRMSQESCEQETQREMLSDREDDMHETLRNTEMLAGCKPIKEHPVQNARVVSRPTYMQAASNLSPSHKAPPLKQHCVLRQCEDSVSFCFKSRRDSAKLLDAEKSLLASLERLDVKLAMASANSHNSSRTSLASAGHQSTKSAPCIIRQKPGSDAYSVNSTMFLSRPTTSQLGGTSLFSKRRQNIGATNVSKDIVNHFQTCNLQHVKRAPLSSGSQKDERRPAAGTIIVHQNAEFLFN
ncbi:hypothetical protein GOP47_0029705 [Adiantum capillus-veneris]|nr:hypothetical protein GOP47_0029705 [Adiantum capillus-veneris]